MDEKNCHDLFGCYLVGIYTCLNITCITWVHSIPEFDFYLWGSHYPSWDITCVWWSSVFDRYLWGSCYLKSVLTCQRVVDTGAVGDQHVSVDLLEIILELLKLVIRLLHNALDVRQTLLVRSHLLQLLSPFLDFHFFPDFLFEMFPHPLQPQLKVILG